MNRKDAVRENEPYVLVEGPGWGKVEFFGKWLVAAAKATALWNKAFEDRIFEQQVALLGVPIFDMAAMSFVLMLQKNHISFMVPLNCELSEELHEVEELAMMIEMGFFVRTGQHYQMAIPVNLNIKTVKVAALKTPKLQTRNPFIWKLSSLPFHTRKLKHGNVVNVNWMRTVFALFCRVSMRLRNRLIS